MTVGRTLDSDPGRSLRLYWHESRQICGTTSTTPLRPFALQLREFMREIKANYSKTPGDYDDYNLRNRLSPESGACR